MARLPMLANTTCVGELSDRDHSPGIILSGEGLQPKDAMTHILVSIEGQPLLFPPCRWNGHKNTIIWRSSWSQRKSDSNTQVVIVRRAVCAWLSTTLSFRPFQCIECNQLRESSRVLMISSGTDWHQAQEMLEESL